MKKSMLVILALSSLSMSAFAEDLKFQCKFQFGDGEADEVIALTVNHEQATISSSNESTGTGKRKVDFHPRNLKNFAMYEGFESYNSDGYSTEVLVETKVLAGQNGVMQIRARGEGFFNSGYQCTKQ